MKKTVYSTISIAESGVETQQYVEDLAFFASRTKVREDSRGFATRDTRWTASAFCAEVPRALWTNVPAQWIFHSTVLLHDIGPVERLSVFTRFYILSVLKTTRRLPLLE